MDIAQHKLTHADFIQGYWRMGEWGMTAQQVVEFVNQHLELGIDIVDHAAIYGGLDNPCEALFGQALSLSPQLREQLHIVTKLGIIPPIGGSTVAYYDSGKQEILQSVDRSLERLGVETIDTLLLHRPDILMDPHEVAECFDLLEQQGKVKSFGVSNFSTHEFALLQSVVSQPLVTNQIEINPLNVQATEDGTLAQLHQLGRRAMAWSCLAGGGLFNPQTEQQHRVVATLTEIQKEVGASSIDQVAFAWVRRLPAKPSAIIGSGKIERVKAAVESKTIELSREQWYRIWTASKGHGVA